MLEKPDGSKWKPTKLDFYTHELMRLKTKLEELKIKNLKAGSFMVSIRAKQEMNYEKKIKELEQKIEMEKMKQK